MQEGDVQIKGYPVRLSLDVVMAFTANPEDYTARGKIITPLKDRIGSEIRTHYPRAVEQGMAITAQEAWLARADGRVTVPSFIAEAVEQVAFAAREDPRVDRRSGVSQRLPISLLEVVVSNAERRAIATGAARAVTRMSDIYAGIPAISGKVELEYEGEMQGAESVARELIRRAAGLVFTEHAFEADVEPIVAWFEQGGALKIGVDEPTATCFAAFGLVEGLLPLVYETGFASPADQETAVAACELVLEALAAHQRIARSEEHGWQRVRPSRRKGGQHGMDGLA